MSLDEDKSDLAFLPSKLAVNESESSFVIYGDKGVVVGNFPSLLQNFRHSRDDKEDEQLA